MYLDNRLEQQQLTYPERIQQATENQDKYQKKYVGDHPDIIFEVGDNVMAREKRYLREPFGPVWSGPFQIIEKLSDLVYVVLRDGKSVKLHVNDIRPFPVGNPVPDLMADSDSESVDQEIDPLQGKDLPYIPTLTFQSRNNTHNDFCEPLDKDLSNEPIALQPSVEVQSNHTTSDEESINDQSQSIQPEIPLPSNPSLEIRPNLRRRIIPKKTCTFYACNCK